MHKAFVIRDDKGKFRDLEDVVKIARALGQQAFKTHENVCVVKVLGPFREIGYLAVVRGPDKSGCSNPLDVRGREKS